MLRFDETMSATLNLRASPMFKTARRPIAELESRSVPNALKWPVLDYFDKNGLSEADTPQASTKRKSEATHARR